jgi:hypothetical protein
MLVAAAADDGSPALARLDELGVPVLVPLLATVRSMQGPASRTLPVEVAGTRWRASINPLLLEDVPPLYLVTAIPEHELMADAYRLIEHSAIATLVVLLFTIPLTWGLARSISRSLGSLASQAEAIRHFDFAPPIAVHSSIREVSDLALTMTGMKQTIHRFLDISQAIGALRVGGGVAREQGTDQGAEAPVRSLHPADRRRHRRQEPLHRRPLRPRAGADQDAGARRLRAKPAAPTVLQLDR